MYSLLPFLVYWLTLQEGGRFSQDPARDHDALAITQSVVLDSQIEECLPQIATLLASTKADGPPWVTRRNRWIEQQVLEKCTSNVQLGLKMDWLLRAALGHLLVPTRRGLPQITGELQRAHLFSLLRTGERLAREGINSPQSLAPLRARYFDHCSAFVSALVQLSLDVRAVHSARRLTALHQGLGRVNRMLFRLMHTRGEEMESPDDSRGGLSWLNEEHIARQCPDVAVHSVHFPLLDGVNPVYRILRLVTSECEVLPSRERCPYTVVAELLQTQRNTRCGSAKLFTRGASLGCTIWDALAGNKFPESLLYPDDLPYPRFPVKPLTFNDHYRGGEDEDYLLDLHAHQGGMMDMELDPRDMDPARRRAVTVRRVYGELWHWKEQRIRNSSPFGRLDGWRLASFIVKAGDDLRQEQVAMQIVALCSEIFREERLDLWLRPYSIICVGDQAGLLECVADAKSIDHIKKRAPHFVSLREYYERVYGQPYSATFRRAQYNFMRSLAAYCIVTYLLQVKDRHNANILIDKQGHVIHIDFGFMLGASPASFGFETAPFKLTREYAQLLGGKDDIMFERFRLAIVQGFQALNKEKHRRRLLDLLRVSILDVPDKANIVEQFFQRLEKVANPAAALAMIDESLDSRRTTWYDSYQLKVNGIMK